ncbi:MAG: hypothetical protein KID00_06855 [Clostridium argentinense]|uniref:Uncharacterized protein n=1 Tax=Clostridium faecium TaxID=2762223 RepID=A0ABR8YTE0_9CLOT|nr:hypothetical protein [Clostridium faecium]MBD8047139.1 hypothetical protein [Clostridium faecium]MBS5823568.1 hypothetical protein [Clostridium argentinense]MDU1349586.1 hypothetical protein [Clostridium argentinense]
MSNEDILNEKKEILDTNVNQIRELSHLFYKCMNKNYFCVLGDKNTIDNNSRIFNNIIEL